MIQLIRDFQISKVLNNLNDKQKYLDSLLNLDESKEDKVTLYGKNDYISFIKRKVTVVTPSFSDEKVAIKVAINEWSHIRDIFNLTKNETIDVFRWIYSHYDSDVVDILLSNEIIERCNN